MNKKKSASPKTRTHPNKEEKPKTELPVPPNPNHESPGLIEKLKPSIGLIGIGVVLGLGLAMLLLQNRARLCEINLGPLKLMLVCEQDPALGCQDYGITITEAQDQENGMIRVKGTYAKNTPPEESVWLLVKSPAGDYFPQKPVLLDRAGNTWQGELRVTDDSREDSMILVSIMRDNGRALFNYYNKVGAETERWPAIETLTDDVEICDRVSVTYEH